MSKPRRGLVVPIWGWVSLCICAASWLLLTGATGMQLQSHPLGYEIKGDKKSYIVVHGGLANRESMLPVAYALADSGHNVVVADLPRHGSSTRSKEQGHTLWSKTIKENNITHAVGHSLGGVWINPKERYIEGIKHTTYIGNYCSQKKSICGTSFLFPLPVVKKNYHIDHLIEPWNPAVIVRIKDVQTSWKVYIYALMPWSIFIFGMLFALAVFRSWYTSQNILESYKKPPVFVAYWVVTFSLLTYRNLWYPFLNGVLDWGILLIGAAVPILIETWLRKTIDESLRWYRYGMSFAHFIYFMLVVGMFTQLSIESKLWPQRHILSLLVMLNATIFPLVYLFVSLLSIEKFSERSWLYSFLTMYLFVLLTPWYSVW